MNQPDFVLSISCPDRRGIVAEVTRFLFERNCNILDSQQFGDRANGRFFLRVHCLSEGGIGIPWLEKEFAAWRKNSPCRRSSSTRPGRPAA